MIWDAMTGQLIDSLQTTGDGWGVAFSPDGRLIASTCLGRRASDKAVMIWDATTHQLIRTMTPPARIQALDLQSRRHTPRRDRR